jgi:hypothetical protein
MNLPRRSSAVGVGISQTYELFIQQEQPEDNKVSSNGAIWIKVNKNLIPYSVYKYDVENKQWVELNLLEQNIYVSQTEPTNKYDNLVWFVLDESNNVSGIKVWVNGEWKDIKIGGSSGSTDTYKVKVDSTDTPDFLNTKVDNETIKINDNKKLSVKFQDDKTENVVWSSQRVTKEAIIKAIIFG